MFNATLRGKRMETVQNSPPPSLTLCRAPRRVRRYPSSPTHVHDFFELAFVSSGECTWVLGGQRDEPRAPAGSVPSRIPLQAGQMLLLPPGRFHHEQYAKGVFPRVGWIGFSAGSGLAAELLPLCHRPLPLPEPAGAIQAILEDVMREQRECLAGWEQAIAFQLQRLVLLIRRGARREGWSPSTPPSEEPATVNLPAPRLVASMESAAYYLRTNCHERHSMSEVAQYFHFSPTYFSAVFTRVIGVSPKRFLRTARIAMARRLLEEGKLTHAAIAQECGFYDEAHFSRTFRAAVGHTPGAG